MQLQSNLRHQTSLPNPAELHGEGDEFNQSLQKELICPNPNDSQTRSQVVPILLSIGPIMWKHVIHKPEVHNVSQCHQKRTEPQPQATHVENLMSLDSWFLRYGCKHTDTWTAMLRTCIRDELIMNDNNWNMYNLTATVLYDQSVREDVWLNVVVTG